MTHFAPNRSAADHDHLESPTSEKYCVFRLEQATFGLLASVVREIAPRPSITLVPDTDPCLAGLCHLRSEFLPVLHLAGFAAAAEHASAAQQIIVVSAVNGPWALLVDRVVGLLPLEVSLCADAGMRHGWSAAVMGSATHQNQVVQVLDANALLRLAEEILSRSSRAQMAV